MRKIHEDNLNNIHSNLSILLEALDVALPYCKRAGIEVTTEKSYDEWEDIVQQYYDSFVLSIVEFEMGTHTISSFKKLGAMYKDDKFQNVLCAEYEGQSFFLDNIVSCDGLRNHIEWINRNYVHRPNSSIKKKIMSPKKLSNFSISIL